jgi:hypothetical protein
MGSLKISKENKEDFEKKFKDLLGRYYGRAARVYRNYGNLFSGEIEALLNSSTCFGKRETRIRRLEVIITVLEAHWETQLHRQISSLTDKALSDVDIGFFNLTLATFYFLYKNIRWSWKNAVYQEYYAEHFATRR